MLPVCRNRWKTEWLDGRKAGGLDQLNFCYLCIRNFYEVWNRLPTNGRSVQLKLRHLQVFNALIEAGSVTRAADRLNLTQPAVSIALNTLEADLGFRLFHRERGFFAPTGDAMLLHNEVAKGLVAVSRIQQRAEDIRLGTAGSVSIATNGALAVNFLPRLIAAFQRDRPGITVDLRVHSSRQIASWVSGGQMDIGVIDPPVPVAGLNAEIFRLECVCIMHRNDPLALAEVIRPDALNTRSVVGITGDHVVDRELERMLSETGTSVRRNVTSYFFAIARNIVAAGNDVAVIDPINGKAELADGVVWRPFEPRIDHELAVITAKGQKMGTAATELCQRIRDGLLVHDAVVAQENPG
ncbi:transcriptional regulator, LysR family [Sedimentitalea nanhaiensis]|uniref:Transcriptional regulator, LysR family n=1 Tax=Sedimentitalea nanhaiensis TaxID=999627 RepID=A0A1I7D358_9RHOB|nr:transcriptional regulator, LysR family [Sedimentitalea nanhaiensis]